MSSRAKVAVPQAMTGELVSRSPRCEGPEARSSGVGQSTFFGTDFAGNG